MTPEFPRPERVDTVGEGTREVALAATADERAALARRFGLLAVDRLEARFRVRRLGSGIEAEGRVEADLVQACSATGVPLPARIDEAVRLRFVGDDAAGEEVELDLADLDTLPIENGAIDLGEAAAETMALALDPFPRAPGAGEALRAAGVLSEEEASPFAALARLRDRIAKQE